MSGTFLPSMIEVNYGPYYQRCAELLFKEGFHHFHMDFGDQQLIGRELECWDKVKFLKTLGKNIKLTSHIMSVSGNHKLSVERIADRCLEEGFELIYIHSRSFKNFDYFTKFKEKIFKNAHNIFGIVSEISSQKDENLINFVSNHSVNNLLQMAVPIGKGGQKFGWSSIDRINDFLEGCKALKSIELDGGLTFEIINKLKKNNINRFAGWSIIYDSDPLEVIIKANKIKHII